MGMTVQSKDRSVGTHFPIAYEDGLGIKVFGGTVNRANASIDVPSASLTLTDDDVNYVFIDWETQTVQANVTGFPAKSYQLYEITTAAGVITEKVDKRAVFRQAAHTEYKTRDTALFGGAFNDNVDWADLDLSANAPMGSTGVFVGIAVSDSGTPGVSVSFSLRKPGETEDVQKIVVFPQVSGLYFCSSAPIGMDSNKKIQYEIKVSGTMLIQLVLLGWMFGG